jgi:Holliday junction resolvasome RuvABC endonuclease subunit
MRYLMLNACLDAARDGVNLVVVEEVQRHAGTIAAHVYGGLLATVQSWCERNGVDYTSIPVASIKTRATGKGNASKAMMIEAANREWPDANIVCDDEADARWIAVLAAEMYGGER